MIFAHFRCFRNLSQSFAIKNAEGGKIDKIYKNYKIYKKYKIYKIYKIYSLHYI